MSQQSGLQWKYSLWLFTLLTLLSCHNEKSWVYKQWHNTLAHYNTFFNAEQKWLETVQQTREGFKEDFRKPIELFNYGGPEVLIANQGPMDEVVKKASTMIDRHPKSKWVDDAYHLMGKAYLFKGDINAAIDLFDYVASQYKDPNMIYLSRLWTVRALLVQGKVPEAEAMAQSLMVNKDLPPKLLPMAQYTLGAIYHKQKKYKQSAELLEKSFPHLHDRMDKYRTYFALGQAYQQLEEYAKAEKCYGKIGRYNPPYEIAFNAQMNRVDILSAKQNNYVKANKLLLQMLHDDKNIEYKGQIYYRMAKNELNSGKTNQAIEKFKTSIIHSNSDLAQKTTSYLSIGDIYFNAKNYELAGVYYDSANKFLDEKHPDFQSIVAKNEILGDLLKHLLKVKHNDSLIRMANDKDWRKLKIKEAILREKLESEKPKPGPGNGGQPNNPMMPGNPDQMNGGMGVATNSSFPFYNMMLRNKGEQEFVKTWGKRDNRDFWRLNSKKTTAGPAGNSNGNDTATASGTETTTKKDETIDSLLLVDVPKEEKRFYIGLPLTEAKQKEKNLESEEALLKTAEIYASRLNEPAQSASYYAQLVTRFPKTKYKAQSYYELVKLARLQNDFAEADKWKNALRDEFPESVYLKMLDNPSGMAEATNTSRIQGSKEIMALYDSVVVAYNAGQFDLAKKIKLRADKQYAGNAFQPRFDFVYALATLKMNDAKAAGYLEQIIVDYPGTDVAERSRNILTAQKRLKDQAEHPVDPNAEKSSESNAFEAHDGKSPLLCLVIIPKGSNVNMIKAGISDLNKKEYPLESIIMGNSISVGSKYSLAIENFSTADKAKFYQQFMTKQTAFFAAKGIFEYEVVWITEKNYQLMIKNLALNDYIQYFKAIKN